MPRRKPPLPPIPKIALRRKRQLTRWQKAALIVGPPIIAIAIIVGIIVENRSGTAEPAAASPQGTPPASSPVSTAGSPTATPTEEQAPADGSEDDPLPFGSTAHFTSTSGSNDIPLEFTVSAPTRFTPSKDAVLFDAVNTYGVPQKGSRQATNVYFTVTIKNTSTTQAFDPDFVFSHVHNTGDDDHISDVHDGDIDSFFPLAGHVIKPGRKVTVKDGFSVKSAATIMYELDVDGLAGRSFYFAK